MTAVLPREPVPTTIDSPSARAGGLRNRSVANLLRMGHCAPSILRTLLAVSDAEAERLVKLTAALPGGIGNTGEECGGVTAPLVLLGLRYGLGTLRQGLPRVVYKGHDLLRRFTRCNGTMLCREIRGHARLPLRCIGVVRRSPELCAQAFATESLEAIPEARREAYCRLYAHFSEQGFHCSHAVLRHLRPALSASAELIDGTSAFLGGTVFTGGTCGAFTAGVMVLGAELGEIENSRPRVLRMIATMAVGGDAFTDERNAFNRTMNLGHRLSRWFVAEFGNTRCRAITACDFSTVRGVERYIESDGTARCEAIAQQVAARVQGMIEHSRES